MLSAWNRFWYAPTDPATLALVRIAFGAVVTLWALSLLPDLGAFFSPSGVLGPVAPAHGAWRWSLLDLGRSDLLLGAVYVALVSGAISLVVGWHTRVAAVVVFVTLISLTRSNPYVFNAGDALLRLLAFYVMLAPSGAEWSLDRRRAGGPAPAVPAWPLRLLQIQVSVMYAGAAVAKLGGPPWRDGTAASYAARLPDLERFGVGDLLGRSRLAAELATYGTVAIEGGLAVLIWWRRTRWFALAAGVLLHLSIDASIRIGFFTLAVFVAYLSFADPAWVRAALAARPHALARLVSPTSPRPATRSPRRSSAR